MLFRFFRDAMFSIRRTDVLLMTRFIIGRVERFLPYDGRLLLEVLARARRVERVERVLRRDIVAVGLTV